MSAGLPNEPTGLRYFLAEGTSIRVRGFDVPWEQTGDAAVAVPSGILQDEANFGEVNADTDEDGDNFGDSPSGGPSVKARRRGVWGMAQVALAGATADEALFRFAGSGAYFTLRPPTRASIPLQWVHVGPGAIPDGLANTPCSTMSPLHMLMGLNLVQGTHYSLDTEGMTELLQHIQQTSSDFGEAYGKVRRSWSYVDPSIIKQRYDELYALDAAHESWRNEAVDSGSFGLRTSHLPPRRTWDLYSNRVLPLAIIASGSSGRRDQVPAELWTVSHSWVPIEERMEVWTPINNKQWPVPLPRATTLEHIRIELLNMGAEYVWLDVLCLRQQGLEQSELIRVDEWKVDVPTIGHIYRGAPRDRPCVTYFNGLGLPLDTSPDMLNSSTHWFNRVWTLQESLETWIPGGITGFPQTNIRWFFSRLNALTILTARGAQGHTAIVPELRRRSCTSELDRIAGLAYLLGCDSLPLYHESLPVESAWEQLLQHAPDTWRMRLLFRYSIDVPFTIFPTWDQYTHTSPVLTDRVEIESHISSPRPEVDFSMLGFQQLLAESWRSCTIYTVSAETGTALDEARLTLELRFGRKDAQVLRLIPHLILGVILQGAAYTIVRAHSRNSWRQQLVILDVVDTERNNTYLTAVKHGVMQLTLEDMIKLEALPQLQTEVSVLYLTGDSARRRSRHANQYELAFKEMRTSGRPFIINDISESPPQLPPQ